VNQGPIVPSSTASADVAALTLPQFGGRQNLRQQVAHALRAALVAGEMRPGVVYSAPALAARFGVSATPVREAMLDLANEGLVKPVRNKGFQATELSDRDLDEITKIRMLIEVPTVRDIAKQTAGDSTTKEKVEALRPLAREIEASAKSRDLIGYIEADRQFHVQLLDIAGNRHLVEVINNLRARSRLYGLQGLADRGELDRSAREHEELITLILAGDARGASDLMRRHINHVRGSWAGRREPHSRSRRT
jgi:DNA-binding GntR family transcriptional regulator